MDDQTVTQLEFYLELQQNLLLAFYAPLIYMNSSYFLFSSTRVSKMGNDKAKKKMCKVLENTLIWQKIACRQFHKIRHFTNMKELGQAKNTMTSPILLCYCLELMCMVENVQCLFASSTTNSYENMYLALLLPVEVDIIHDRVYSMAV